MKISYCITSHNETNTLFDLLNLLTKNRLNDEIIILDDFSTNKETQEIVDGFANNTYCHLIQRHLNNNYGQFKNEFIKSATGNFIFAIDGDELPSEFIIGENLHAIIESNPGIEAYAIPRINDFRGITHDHAKQWGWNLSLSPQYNRPIVNWPDYQFRVFSRNFPRISFTRRLHEKIEGYNSFVCLPPDEKYALYHNKTIEKQVETNKRYNESFTLKENQGHNVFDK